MEKIIYPPQLIGSDDYELDWEDFTDENRLILSAIKQIERFGSKADAVTAKVQYMYFRNTTGTSSKSARNSILKIQDEVRYKWASYLKYLGVNIDYPDQLSLMM